MTETNNLIVPDAAKRDPGSFEILRVWVASQAQHVSLRTGVWEDPFAWGIVLADLARHVANAYSQTKGADQEGTLQRIMSGLDAEMKRPTDRATGSVIDEK